MRKPFRFLPLLLLCAVLFFACTDEPAVEPPAETALPRATEIAEVVSTPKPIVFRHGAAYTGEEKTLTLVIDADEFSLLDRFPALMALDLSGSTCYEAIEAYRQSHPDVSVRYTVPLGDQAVPIDAESIEVAQLSDPSALARLPALQSLTVTGPMSVEDAAALVAAAGERTLHYTVNVAGKTIASDTETLDLSAEPSASAASYLAAIPALPKLSKIVLSPAEGESEWTLDQADAFQRAKEGLLVDYRTEAFGVTFSLADEVVSFNDIPLNDKVDEVRALLPYLRNVKRVDMEYCRIRDEEMAKLREEFPAPKIVWRIYVGSYWARTDAVMIRFSFDVPERWLRDKDTTALKYCNEVRFLDLGHNRITKADFLAYMPDLEVCIIAAGVLADISGVANHDKLEYCEFLSGRIKDLTPLASCPNLEHLNLSYNLISDITPLYGLKKLKRLWISRNYIPEEQIEEIRRQLPDTEINTTSHNPTGEGWRYISERDLLYCERYEKLRKQFQYEKNLKYYTAEDMPDF